MKINEPPHAAFESFGCEQLGECFSGEEGYCSEGVTPAWWQRFVLGSWLDLQFVPEPIDARYREPFAIIIDEKKIRIRCKKENI